jgi:hypothetical protein
LQEQRQVLVSRGQGQELGVLAFQQRGQALISDFSTTQRPKYHPILSEWFLPVLCHSLVSRIHKNMHIPKGRGEE